MTSNYLIVSLVLLAATTRGYKLGSQRHARDVTILSKSTVNEAHKFHKENAHELTITGDPSELEAIAKYLSTSFKNHKSYTKTVCETESMKLSCLPGQGIKVVDAFYGRNTQEICDYDQNIPENLNCHSPPHSKAEVEKRCNLKQTCTVRANNDVFTDPCLNTYKYLRVSYMCFEEPLRTVSACDQYGVRIACPQGEIIKVNSAEYGRTKHNVCNSPVHRITTLTCQADAGRITEIAVNKCDGKQSCEVHTIHDVVASVGDPCFGVFKHLDVNYLCI
uniref:L-rhamnose-binding lectin CSL3 n=1 Tax=Lygus hesperus TaxID=30085 RepID=A0A146MDG0_LYGHE